MTDLPRNWREYWAATPEPAYAPHANSLGCWSDAISAIRLRLVRDGDVVPREDEPVPLNVLRVLE